MIEKIVGVLLASAAFYLAVIALALIALGWCLSKASRLVYRRIEAEMSAEEQAEQIIRSCWPEEVT